MSAPLNLVSLERVSKAHGTTVLLDDVSLGIAAGERIGVVGRNGSGKSTLLGVLTGAEEPDSGRVTRRGDVALGVLDQSGTLPPGATVRDVVLPPTLFAAEHEWAADPAVRSVLTGLELDRLGLDAPVAPMSGGERRRVALAAQLVRPLDLLVLDEPTNHLDVEGVAWLAEYVRSRVGALVVVTHDRWFLDEVCSTTWEVSGGSVFPYEGGYSAYTLARAERARIAAATEERRLNLVRKELAWLRRGPPARTSKPRFRIEAAEALIADEPPPRESMALKGFAARRLGRTVYDVEDVTLTLHGRGPVDDADDPAGPADPPSPAHPTARCSGTSPGTSARATGSASSGSTARARRRCCGCWSASCSPTRAGWCAVRPWRRPTSRSTWSSCPGACGCWRRCRRSPGSRGSATRRSPRRRWPSGSGSPRRGSGRRSGTSPAASGAGCSCCGCSWASRTCCCSTSRPTTSTSTRSPRWRTCSTPSPAPCWWSATTGTSSTGCATRWSR
jgi:ABC-type multidrug transport system ATPase subunit